MSCQHVRLYAYEWEEELIVASEFAPDRCQPRHRLRIGGRGPIDLHSKCDDVPHLEKETLEAEAGDFLPKLVDKPK